FMLWLTRRTRLYEDAAIGAVLSVFFGFGVVLLTVIQTVSIGRPAGLSDFLLGMTAGMLYRDAVLIATAGLLAIAAVWALRRPMTLVAFDSGFASASGIRVRYVDLAITGLVLAVTIIGLKIVGLILIVALLIIPPVAARFWSDRVDHVLLISSAIGGAAGYLGAALSAVAPALPTGPIIVLVAFALFVISLLFSPVRGVFSVWLRHRRQQRRIHLRQGLLAIAQDVPIYEHFTIALLLRAGFVRGDGVPTEEGRRQADQACRDEDRWAVARRMHAHESVVSRFDGLRPLESLLTVDEIAEIDRQLTERTECKEVAS
ncbi:MAG TPA: metal ABC transporter permease, partial [Halothiobacillaceae bacterium]|nr:metal ABC transporter permease [Halothiobacillaceae bacterium]